MFINNEHTDNYDIMATDLFALNPHDVYYKSTIVFSPFHVRYGG